MTTGNTDIDTLASDTKTLRLVSGLEIKVDRLRTRAMMSLLKIFTHGASEVLNEMAFDMNTTTEDFTGKLLGAMVFSIPNAQDETIEFLQRMVSPAEVIRSRRPSKADIEADAALEARLSEELYDPDPEDTVTILEEIIRVEAPHIMALGKRLGVLIQAQQMSEAAKQGASSKRSSGK